MEERERTKNTEIEAMEIQKTIQAIAVLVTNINDYMEDYKDSHLEFYPEILSKVNKAYFELWTLTSFISVMPS